MATSTPERARMTLTIPADCIDDFKVGVLADLKCDADGFGVEHRSMLEAKDDERREGRRIDRDGHLKFVRDTCELLEQLPGEVVETTVSGTAEAFRFALEEAGRRLVGRVRREFEYCPVPAEDGLPLLDRVRWTAEQVAMIQAVA